MLTLGLVTPVLYTGWWRLCSPWKVMHLKHKKRNKPSRNFWLNLAENADWSLSFDFDCCALLIKVSDLSLSSPPPPLWFSKSRRRWYTTRRIPFRRVLMNLMRWHACLRFTLFQAASGLQTRRFVYLTIKVTTRCDADQIVEWTALNIIFRCILPGLRPLNCPCKTLEIELRTSTKIPSLQD